MLTTKFRKHLKMKLPSRLISEVALEMKSARTTVTTTQTTTMSILTGWKTMMHLFKDASVLESSWPNPEDPRTFHGFVTTLWIPVLIRGHNGRPRNGFGRQKFGIMALNSTCTRLLNLIF